MIEIYEISPPEKVSGLSSFVTRFTYNLNLVNALAEICGPKGFYYHKKEDCYEFPAPFLQAVLDRFTYYDEMKLHLLKTEDGVKRDTSTDLTAEELSQFRVKPFEHQQEGINFGLDPNHKRWLNLYSMGLGKSLMLIYEAETLKRRGLIDHCLIICGVDALRQQWKKEIQDFSTESVCVVGERISKSGKVYYNTLKERAAQLKNPIDEFFVITNIAALRDEGVLKAILKSKNKFGLIGLDEAHRVARKTSTSGKHLLKLSAEYMVAMSGSLVTNNPVSCYMPLAWTGNDQSILTTFKSEYIDHIDERTGVVYYRYLEHLKEELQNCSLRKKLEDVKDDMPSKTISVELIEMTDAQAKYYESVKDGIKEAANKVDLKPNNILAMTTRLRQATSDPSIISTDAKSSAKLDRCVDLVEDLMDAGEKVVIMDVFKGSINNLAKLLEKYDPLVVTGDTSGADTTNRVNEFKTNPDKKLLLGTAQKIGTGFSFPEAHYLIMLSTPWTWAEFSQNTDRIHRINSTAPVYVKVLITKDTIDEHVWDIITTKKEIADYLVDNIMPEEAGDIYGLSYTDIVNSLALTTQDDMRTALRRSLA